MARRLPLVNWRRRPRWLRRVAEDPLPLVRQAAALRKEISAKPDSPRARASGTSSPRPGEVLPKPTGCFSLRSGWSRRPTKFWLRTKPTVFRRRRHWRTSVAGLAGILLALARRGPVSGVDRDPVVTLLAEANLDALCLRTSGFQPRILLADAAAISLEDYAAWHVDPDRRPQGRRTTQVDLHEPAASI